MTPQVAEASAAGLGTEPPSRSENAADRDECDDPTCGCHQLAWLDTMERIEREEFPDSLPRGEITVPANYLMRRHEP